MINPFYDRGLIVDPLIGVNMPSMLGIPKNDAMTKSTHKPYTR